MTQNDAPSTRSMSAESLDALTATATTPEPRPERDSGDDGTDKRPSRGKSVWRFIRDILLILLAAIVISFLIKTFLIRSFYIPSPSMTNTLQVNDRIIVNELEPSLVPISRGDIVVFRDPGGWLPPGTENTTG